MSEFDDRLGIFMSMVIMALTVLGAYATYIHRDALLGVDESGAFFLVGLCCFIAGMAVVAAFHYLGKGGIR